MKVSAQQRLVPLANRRLGRREAEEALRWMAEHEALRVAETAEGGGVWLPSASFLREREDLQAIVDAKSRARSARAATVDSEKLGKASKRRAEVLHRARIRREAEARRREQIQTFEERVENAKVSPLYKTYGLNPKKRGDRERLEEIEAVFARRAKKSGEDVETLREALRASVARDQGGESVETPSKNKGEGGKAEKKLKRPRKLSPLEKTMAAPRNARDEAMLDRQKAPAAYGGLLTSNLLYETGRDKHRKVSDLRLLGLDAAEEWIRQPVLLQAQREALRSGIVDEVRALKRAAQGAPLTVAEQALLYTVAGSSRSRPWALAWKARVRWALREWAVATVANLRLDARERFAVVERVHASYVPHNRRGWLVLVIFPTRMGVQKFLRAKVFGVVKHERA